MLDNPITSTRKGYAVLDLETTGLSPDDGARIIEIGVVAVDAAGAVEATWETIVDPGCGPGPTQIHGVSAAMLEGAPGFDDIAGNLAEVLDGRVLVAHNARFDVGFLDAEFSRVGLAWTRTALCTLQLAKRRSLPLSLAAACKHFGIVNSGAHRALDDAQATATLLERLQATAAEIPEAVAFPGGWPAPVDAARLQPRQRADASAPAISQQLPGF